MKKSGDSIKPTDTNVSPKPMQPKWVMDRSVSETLEGAAFSSGATLSLLQQTLFDPALNVPQSLLRNRLALKSAVNCLKIERRLVNEADIRDGFLLAQQDGVSSLEQAMGPSGFMFAQWRDLVQVSLSKEYTDVNFIGSIPIYTRETMGEIILADEMVGAPVVQTVRAIKDVLKTLPKEETLALQWADIVLSKALGWKYMLPMISCTTSGAQLRSFTSEDPNTDDLAIIVHNAIARSAREVIHLAHDLERRAAKLRAVVPKLRAKGSDKAVELFLNEDAVSPSTMLAPKIKGSNILMTDRSARRLCDRLVELGVVRELTGRSTYRFYGV